MDFVSVLVDDVLFHELVFACDDVVSLQTMMTCSRKTTTML
jgi:hypothetical protein